MGRKLGATPCFGKAAEHPIIVVSKAHYVHLADHGTSPVRFTNPSSSQQKARAQRPGLFQTSMPNDQAAALENFANEALSGSTTSFPPFSPSSFISFPLSPTL